jgi:hypothetical protein
LFGGIAWLGSLRAMLPILAPDLGARKGLNDRGHSRLQAFRRPWWPA